MSLDRLTVRAHRVNARLHTEFVTATRRASHADSLLVEIEDADGHRGWGECPQVWRITGESVAGAEACVTGPLAAALTAAPTDDQVAPDDFDALLDAVENAVVGNRGAKAAVDTALHDLLAQQHDLALADLLRGRYGWTEPGQVRPDALSTAVTLSVPPTGDGLADALVEAAQSRVDEGFTVLKVKVGSHAGPTEADALAKVRAEVGPTVTIRADANQGWRPPAAIGALRAMADAGCALELIEQPVAADDLTGMAYVRSSIDVPVMADESLFGLRDLDAIVQAKAADMVNVKLAKCGGLRTAAQLLRTATEYGLGTSVGSMVETEVGIGAAAALVAGLGSVSTVCDLDAGWWLAEATVDGGVTYADGQVVLPDGPGAGVRGLR